MTENMLSSVIEFDEDLSNVEAPKPLPAGNYDSVIESAEPIMSKNGNPMVKVTHFISSDQYPADYTDGNPEGTRLTQYLMLGKDQRSKYQLKQFCLGIGAALSNSIDVNTWVGNAARVEVVNEIYEGNLNARLKKVLN